MDWQPPYVTSRGSSMTSYRDDLEKGLEKQKVRFYSDPKFAGLVGLGIGVAGTLLLQWIF